MEEGEENPPSPQKPDPVPYSEIQTRWNTIAAKHGLPLCQRMTEPRRKAIKARFGESGMEGIVQAFDAIEQSDFCLGLKTDFRADFDFVFQAKSFTRLIEGSYAGRANGSGGNRRSPGTFGRSDIDRLEAKYGKIL
ncbi:hypothetical protein [Blastomonas sp. CCH3-A3]|nr:hypothetical protein [Blastomonas sp. CCH3-A3]